MLLFSGWSCATSSPDELDRNVLAVILRYREYTVWSGESFLLPTERKLIGLSYLEGIFFAFMVASSESIALYAFLKKGLSYWQLGLVTTLPLLIGALAQWRIPARVPQRLVRAAILVAMSVQLLGVAFLWAAAHRFHFILVLVGLCCYWAGGLCAGPLWLDWISRHVSRERFSRVIARRSGFISLATLVFYLFIAHRYQFSPHFDLASVFAVGAGARLLSMVVQAYLSYGLGDKLTRQNSNPLAVVFSAPLKSAEEFDILKILKVFFLWAGIFKIAVYVSSPFFLPYMIEVRNFTLWDYCVVTGMAMLGRSLFLGVWARASVGIMPFVGLQLAGLGISTIPLVWTFSNRFAAALLVEFASGIFWGGFELCAILIVQNFVSEAPRRLLGLEMAIMNSAATLGSLIGSQLLALQMSYHLVFALSSLLRFVTVVGFIFYLGKWPMLRLTLYGINNYFSSYRGAVEIKAGRR